MVTGHMDWFEVPGDPVAKGRPRLGNGRVYTPPKTQAYERMVGYYGNVALPGMLEGPVCVRMLLTYGVPQSWSKKRKNEMVGAYKTGRPDIDNAAKAILDGLNGIAYRDDDQVVDLRVVRVWGWEGFARVWVGELNDVEDIFA